MRLTVTLHFPKGYIAEPYWPAREKLINIQKQSGVNRVRSEDKRVKTLKAWLDTHEMSLDDYRALEVAATKPFYTQIASDEIVVPAHQLHGCMAQAAALAPASIRFAKPEQIRSVLEWDDLATGRTKPDGVWERFVPVKSGTGQTLSNQRGLRSSPYLSDLTATGTLRIINEDIEKKVRDFVAWAGVEIGVGAARKMSWGRFTITAWALQG